MIVRRREGCTRVVGKSQGYIGLPLRDVREPDPVHGPATPAMQSAWEPTPAEFYLMSLGAPVILTVVGSTHPPVRLEVGSAPGTGVASRESREALANRLITMARDEWIEDNDPRDGTDVVTPYDAWFYGDGEAA